MGNNNLNRYPTTISITPEQYERLFFQPAPPRGDASKRFGNPTILGVLGFLVPFQTTVLVLLGFRGSSPESLAAICGSMYMFGGLALVIAGIFEFVLGNTFPMAVFIIFGAHWVQTGFSNDPNIGLAASYQTTGGAASLPYNSGGAFYNISMLLVCFVFLLGSLRTNLFFVIVFFSLIPLFGLLAAGNWYIGYNPTPEGIAHAFYLFQIAGGFGFVTALCGWYLAIVTSCASTGVPCPLPIFDMSGMFSGKKAPERDLPAAK